jgi:hypothetical protein
MDMAVKKEMMARAAIFFITWLSGFFIALSVSFFGLYFIKSKSAAGYIFETIRRMNAGKETGAGCSSPDVNTMPPCLTLLILKLLVVLFFA